MLRRTECSSVFQNGSFSPSLAGSMRRFFPHINYDNLVKFLEVKLVEVWCCVYDWVPLEFLSLRLVHTKSAAIHQLQFRICFPWRFLLCYVVVFCICLTVSSLLVGTGLPCDLTSLMDLRRIVDFSVCSAFYVLLG